MLLRRVKKCRHLARAILFSTVACALAGCDVPRSINPFYRSQDLVFDSSLIGEWQSADPSEKGGLLITARTADSYTIESTYDDEDREGEATWTFEGHQFTYKQDSYLDLFPVDFSIQGKKESIRADANGMLLLIPVHSVMRLHHDGQKLSLAWIGENEPLNLFTKEDEASKAKRLAKERRDHDILTMSTDQLQQEVLGPPKGRDVSETRMDFVRKK